MNFLQKIFSIKNQEGMDNKAYRVITICGVKIKIKNNIKTLENAINNQKLYLKKINHKIDVLKNEFDYNFTNKNEMLDGVAIAYATSESGVKYLLTSCISLLENKNPNTNYHIFVLHTPEVSAEQITTITDLKNKYQNVEFKFYNMGDSFQKVQKGIEHIPYATYYRLKLADIVPKEYNKVIYLDIDTIVLKDLNELYNVPLNNNYIAGIVAFGYFKTSNYPYLNAGVTLWNLEKIRTNNMTKELCSLTAENFSSMDQDIVNMAFEGNKMVLPLKYNVMTTYKKYISNKNTNEYFLFKNVYGEYNIYEAMHNPVIIHYVDKIKPWQTKTIMFADKWWKYAEKNPYYKTLLKDYNEAIK